MSCILSYPREGKGTGGRWGVTQSMGGGHWGLIWFRRPPCPLAYGSATWRRLVFSSFTPPSRTIGDRCLFCIRLELGH